MCAVVLVTAPDLQAITLAPVETPGCEGAVEPVCTLAYVSLDAKVTCVGGAPWVGDYVLGCTKGWQGRSCSPSLMVTGQTAVVERLPVCCPASSLG